MKKPLLISILTVIPAAGVTAWMLLRAADTTREESATPHSPVQQARAFTAAVAGTDTRGKPAKLPPSATVPPPAAAPLTAEEILLIDATRLDFLRIAERTGDMQLRIAALFSLEDELRRNQNLFATPAEPPLATPAEGDAGYRRRLEFLRAEREGALRDLTTLTPEAREQWEHYEAAGWRETPRFRPPGELLPVSPEVYDALQAFGHQRAARLFPLVRAYERHDDRRWELSELWNAGPSPEADVVDGMVDAAVLAEVARTDLLDTLMEAEKQRRAWSAKGWEGYGEQPVISEQEP